MNPAVTIRIIVKWTTVVIAKVYLWASRNNRQRRPIRVVRATAAFFGHLALEPENYLSARKAGTESGWAIDGTLPHTRDWWSLGKLAASPNPTLARAWRQHVVAPASWWIDALTRAGRQSPHLALPDVNASLFGVGNALDQTSTQFQLSPKQLRQAHRELEAIGIDPSRPYVALVVRDAHYFDKFGKTLSDGRMRNRELSDFVPSVLQLVDLGVQVVRMGHLVASPLQVLHPLVFDYATSGHRSELLDIFLPLNATAVVSTLTGSDAVALVGRRPVLYIDIALYAQVFHATSRATWIPARLRVKATGRTLTLSEVFSLGAGWFVGPEQFESAGLEAVQSSPEEIACYVADFMECVLAHGEYRGDANLQQQGRAALAAAMGRDGQAMHGDVRSQILDGFLSRSPGFLL